MNKIYHFDIFHHLTFNQYRTPSPGFWLDIPFVMGPIGGAECIAPAFWEDLEPNTVKKEGIRQKGKDLKIFKWFNTRKKNNKVILCSCKENLNRLKPYGNKSRLELMPAIAFDKKDFADISQNETQDTFEMIYAGKAWDWKGIHIFLKAAKVALMDKLSANIQQKWSIKLIGIRFEEEQKKVMGWVDELGLQNHVTLIPFIQRSELLKMLANCSLSVYPAFRDSGSMSVLEACALGCPSICFNAGGQDVFSDEILLKVDVADSYSETMNRFSEKLFWAYEHPQELKEIGKKAKVWVEEMLTWDRRVEDFHDIYKTLV